MQKPPYFRRSLVSLFLLLPLLFQLFAVATLTVVILCNEMLGVRAEEGLVFVSIPFALGFLFICVRSGRKALPKPVLAPDAASSLSREILSSPPFTVRYLPVIIAFAYTLSVAIVALFLPVPTEGAIFGPASGILALAHLPSSLLFILGLMFGVPSIWFFLIPPLAIYGAYGCGIAWRFRELKHPGSLLKSRLVSATILLAALAVIVWRTEFMTAGFVQGNGREELYAESVFNRNHQPFQPDNTLVKIPSPTLVIEHDHPVLDGATAVYPVYAAAVQALYKNIDARNRSSVVACSTTPEAYKRLIAREADLVFVAQPSKDQLAAAEAAGNPLRLTPIAKEAFVFFVHTDNPVDGLTSDQIRAIYTKRIVNWKEVGGRDEKILPFQRPQGSGSQTAFERKVMRDAPLPPPLREEFARGMGGVIQRVAAYHNSSQAIGYSFRVYTSAMNAGNGIKLLKIDGVAPTREHIRSGEYPYTVDLYAATAGTANPNVPALVAWFLGAQGQELIDATGYVSLTPASPEQSSSADGSPPK